jgi:hypothetical protein
MKIDSIPNIGSDRPTMPTAQPRYSWRPDQREEEGNPITRFVVEGEADRVLALVKTQGEVIHWARSRGYAPHVARVRHLNDKAKPDHWRKV